MAYSAYERTAGTSVINEVSAMERHLTNKGIGAFDSDTTPTLSQVEEFITDIYYDMGLKLMSNGYAQVQTDADVLGALQRYNVFGACAQIELTQPSVGYKGGENTRYDRFFKEYDKLDSLLQTAGFERLGAVKSFELSAGLSAGGISISDKETIETDTDFESYIFTKDRMRHPGSTQIEEETTQV